MKVSILAKTNARFDLVERISENLFKIQVKSLPEKGKANIKIAELLADNFRVPKSNVKIIKGHKSKFKTFEIIDSKRAG